MANLMLTKACNLNCPYCFANEFVNKTDSDNVITRENFLKAKEFLLTGGDQFGLIGGEPTTHPLILDFMQDIIDDNRVRTCTLFTNGINFDKVIYKFINEKFFSLINVNSLTMMGDVRYNKMLENIEMLHNKFNIGHRVSFGYNIYGTDFDYQYIIDLCKKYNKNSLRISICVPNDEHLRNLKSLEWFRLVAPRLFEFYEALYQNGIVPHYDCNYLPICIPTLEQKNTLLKIRNLALELGVETNLLSTCSTCMPIIDILPNLQAVRCFGLSDYDKATIDNFSNIRELGAYFDTVIDSYKFVTIGNSECRECPKRVIQDCTGGCLAYKAKLMKSTSDRVNTHQEESYDI